MFKYCEESTVISINPLIRMMLAVVTLNPKCSGSLDNYILKSTSEYSIASFFGNTIQENWNLKIVHHEQKRFDWVKRLGSTTNTNYFWARATNTLNRNLNWVKTKQGSIDFVAHQCSLLPCLPTLLINTSSKLHLMIEILNKVCEM